MKDLDTERRQIVVGRILAVLADGPATSATIAERVHIHRAHAVNYVLLLRKQKVLHIGKWHRPETGPVVAMYAIGSGPDKPKPKALTQKQIQRRYRIRLKQDAPDKYVGELLKSRARRLRPQRDIAAAWIGGDT